MHADGDKSVAYTEYETKQEAIDVLAAYCDTYNGDKGFHVTFNIDGKALIENDNDVVAFACVFPPLITEEVES